MNSKSFRNFVFILHRFFGLTVGLIMIVVGVTGSLLVFQNEISYQLEHRLYGHIAPQEQQVTPDSVLNAVKAAHISQKDLTLDRLYIPSEPGSFYKVSLLSSNNQRIEDLINPYTGIIVGESVWDNTLFGITAKLHQALLAGNTGTIIVGIGALVLFILCVTGIILWPGWRKLDTGFKIKWNAHPKRMNFDIHKVAGIACGVFLALTSFTGFCWNFRSFADSMIHIATFTPQQPKPVSHPIANKSPLELSTLLQKADAALPFALTTTIYLPHKPEEAFKVRKKLPRETGTFGSSYVYLDQYTGEVVKLINGLRLSRAELLWKSLKPLHMGTFGGLPTRILYIFVGFAPLFLFVTGFRMWWYRKKGKNATHWG
ncbi:PepSY-associated TM helix domain-containing protein [Aetokthonos hydrillicola]|nr:PepSY-associated TM helix domain-containing protein [Aetokthonos hydrillicola]MBO3459281.1 PepSY domain-containing protein [Aetokthonos hydrillicola CCALA 1050]MBW4590591.1 PepSY domain-containing protein [Aetokthonos hydrillicola CCALA 1050]